MRLKFRASSHWHSAKLTAPLIMSYNLCSGNFSSRSLGVYPRYSGSSCGSSYPSNLVYVTKPQSSSTCQLGLPLSTGCQETSCETTSCEPTSCQPTSFQTPCVVPRPCQTSCYRPRTSSLCQTTYTGSLGYGSSSCRSLGYGSRSSYSSGCGSRQFYSSGCGSSGFRPLSYGVRGCSSLNSGSRIFCPTYLASGNCQSPCYRPTYASSFCRSAY
nr:keratin-associated protein 13-2-like [Oryctolagus cuniculus]